MELKKTPEIIPHIYTPFIIDKGAKNIQWRKNSIFNKCFWKILHPCVK